MLTIVLFTCTMLTEAACAALLQCATLHYRSQDVLFARVIYITPCCTQDRRPVYHALLSLLNHSQADFWQPPQQAPLHRTVLPQGPSKNNLQIKTRHTLHAGARDSVLQVVPLRTGTCSRSRGRQHGHKHTYPRTSDIELLTGILAPSPTQS